MPTRDYRKGITDGKEPVPCSVRTHITRREFARLKAAADSRSLTLSKLLRSLVTTFVTDARLNLPHPKGPSSEALRELCRIGNNLNQIANQANLMRLPLIEAEARTCLKAVLAAVDRLR